MGDAKLCGDEWRDFTCKREEGHPGYHESDGYLWAHNGEEE